MQPGIVEVFRRLHWDFYSKFLLKPKNHWLTLSIQHCPDDGSLGRRQEGSGIALRLYVNPWILPNAVINFTKLATR